ncbi:MAG: DUF1294 domain-containing protein [Burkholderiaceae bacterium]
MRHPKNLNSVGFSCKKSFDVWEILQLDLTLSFTLRPLVSMVEVISGYHFIAFMKVDKIKISCNNAFHKLFCTVRKTDMRYQGRISSWKGDQGFGFITQNGGNNQVFVHIKSFSNRRRRPSGDEIVTYKLKIDANGRAQAENVAFVGERAPSANTLEPSKILPILTVAFLAFLVVSAIFDKVPFAVLGIYLVASVITFLAYAFDKIAARKNQWRTREDTLHILAFIGGWPGALAAQRLLRHKSRKQSFQTIYWVTVVLNCGALSWTFSSEGTKTLHSFLAGL